MFKKTILTGLSAVILASSVSAINLEQFNSDFYALVQGIGRDVAPSLRLGALAGDIQGDASIEHFSVGLGMGVNATNGLGTNLQPGAYSWQATPSIGSLVNNNISNTFFERLMLYPSLKTSFGMAVGTWDFTVSAMYLPQAVTQALANSSAEVAKLSPQFSFGNFGLQVRKKIISDSGAFSWVPGLSLGAGYHISFFNLATTINSLSDVGIGAQNVGTNQTMDMKGTMNFGTLAQVATIDLHVSKHIAFLTPYLKLSGAYQNSTFTGSTNLVATVTDSVTPANDSTQNINANPVVNVSDFAFILNPGLEFDILAVVLNVNALIDLGQANLEIPTLISKGYGANGIALNAGLRVAF